MLDELTDEQLVRVAAVICKGKLELRAQTFLENGWDELVAIGLLRKTFTPWARRQHTVMANKSAEVVIMDNISRAATIAADYDLLDVANFLITHMSRGHLPELLSHENDDLRDAAANRLEVLATSIAEKK